MNMIYMSFQRAFIYFIFLQLFNCLLAQCPHGQGRGVAKQKADMHRQGEGGREVENWKKC